LLPRGGLRLERSLKPLSADEKAPTLLKLDCCMEPGLVLRDNSVAGQGGRLPVEGVEERTAARSKSVEKTGRTPCC